MKKVFLPLLIICLCLANIMVAQSKKAVIDATDSQVEKEAKSYPIDARPFLKWGTEFARTVRAENPSYLKEAELRKTTAWNFQVGDAHTFWARDTRIDDFDAPGYFYQVSATCRGVGEHCYIFVEDATWTAGRADQTGIDGIVNSFDNTTPADPSRGIYEMDVAHFGSPPNVDGDDKIIILVLDILDDYSGSGGGYIAGYFHSYNEIMKSQGDTYQYSNEAEMYYLDAYPGNLATPEGISNAMNTAAHEFQHMINWNYNPLQHTFFDEGCSMLAEYICGYPFREQSSFANETNHWLLDWRDDEGDEVLKDYSRAARFMLYMYEQFGTDFILKFVQASTIGTSGIDEALGNLSTSTDRRFNPGGTDISNNIMMDWFMANILDNKDVNPRWGYDLEGLAKGVPRGHLTPNVNVTGEKVAIMAAQYIQYSIGENLTFNINFTNPNMVVKAIKVGSGLPVVEDVPKGTDYNIPDFGSTYTNVYFALLNKSITGSASYDYVSTGTGGVNNVQIAYDDAEPTGVLPLSPNDTVCVEFQGVPGTKLRRISVALRQAGTLPARIFKYTSYFETGASVTSPLGEPLSPEFDVTSTIAEKPEYDQNAESYPVPFPNWVDVNLTEYNIDTEEDFAVAVLIPGTYPETNRVMVTQSPAHTSYYHSSNYVNNPSSGAPRWLYYVGGDGGQTYKYLIRATVTYDITGVEEEIELLPKSFALEQNYPNPFNPSTTINYTLPEVSNVTIKVYDMIGREVTTLVNEEKSAGAYQTYWNGMNSGGQKVSSGVYFYTISTDNFVQTKKMILMK